jgi:hypothetical protein
MLPLWQHFLLVICGRSMGNPSVKKQQNMVYLGRKYFAFWGGNSYEEF